jgi:hypothetical protein
MRNLLPYSGVTIDVHRRAVSSKQDIQLKSRLETAESVIADEFANYNIAFEANALSTLNANASLAVLKEDLLSLYSYQNSTIRGVRNSIRERQDVTIQTTCQNCTINSVNSMDHVLPKSNFPEFVVNPLNLFPSCTECNGYKLTAYGQGGNPLFLNLYTDTLPTIQYLFVDVHFRGPQDLLFSFYLNNANGAIPANEFSLIESHYKKLHLLQRFHDSAKELVKSLDVSIAGYLPHLPINEIIRIANGIIDGEKVAYGQNNWRCVFKSALINSANYIVRFQPQS